MLTGSHKCFFLHSQNPNTGQKVVGLFSNNDSLGIGLRRPPSRRAAPQPGGDRGRDTDSTASAHRELNELGPAGVRVRRMCLPKTGCKRSGTYNSPDCTGTGRRARAHAHAHASNESRRSKVCGKNKFKEVKSDH
ncbi:hypothetical protein EVAR_63699_1 [Eumeta japonica]|uniref:Uncharacterized protein n=1 Tax=Eumeta variegata TaxID=151549 RepID=A0A4C1ZVH3_EUMVA|nr:hypothetical protein EVAR_63699_1 [Eumeta japonica]